MPDLNATLENLRGKFIVLDGPDGSGKTTVQKLLAERLAAAGLPLTLCKDPGGTAVGDRIRSVLLDHDLTRMGVQCETLLFMASRAQLVKEVIQPAQKEGRVVLCDRFISSTCAYQVAAGDNLDAILQLARYAVEDTWPAMTFILDVPVEVGFARIGRRISDRRQAQLAQSGGTAEGLDAMERRPTAFHEAVRANFLALPGRYPGRVEVVDATRPAEHSVRDIMNRLARETV